MMRLHPSIITLLASAIGHAHAALDWKNVKIGGGGGFVDGIVFHPKSAGVAYARTDIGGLYRLNSADDSWTPVTDYLANDEGWHNWGIDAVAVDPQDDNVVWAAVGLYSTNTTWDTNGSIIRSTNRGATWKFYNLPFKVGGNMPGRGTGERLAVDPKNSNIVYFGARSGNGLWRSTDGGLNFKNVTSFTAVGNYAQDLSDATGYQADLQGLTFVTFDSTSDVVDGATSRIIVGSANVGGVESIWVTNDAGKTWEPLKGQPKDFIPHKCKLQPVEQALYFSFSDCTGPFDGKNGSVWRYELSTSTWQDITPVPPAQLKHGFGGLSVDLQKPGTVMVAALNLWYPDVQIFRSIDAGKTWSTLWEYAKDGSENLVRHHTISSPKAPWIEAGFLEPRGNNGPLLGWMVEALEIDPFNSDHWLYGTGLTVYGGRDLTKWDRATRENITIESMADGIEQIAVLGLKSTIAGSELLVAAGDVDGFTFRNAIDIRNGVPPEEPWMRPQVSTTNDVDYAGNSPDHVVRVGNSSDGRETQLVLSNGGGDVWFADPRVTDKTIYGGMVAYSADAYAVLWSSWNKGTWLTVNGSNYTTVPELDSRSLIAADRRNDSVFYGVNVTKLDVLVSPDYGVTFNKGGHLDKATKVTDIAAHPGKAGEVYVSTDVGIFKSTDYAVSFSRLSDKLTKTEQISIGLANNDYTAWNLFAFGSGPAGRKLYGSSDGGGTWVDIQGDDQGFGRISSDKTQLAGSGNVPGRVYVGTNGRGVFYADGIF